MEYTDENVPINCSECNELEYGVNSMLAHILRAHPDYSHSEAENYARIWADDAYDQIELQNIERAEEFRRTGYDSWDD